jgi:hypothetical protein
MHKSEAALDASIAGSHSARHAGQQNATNARRRVEAGWQKSRRVAVVALLPALSAIANARTPPRRPASKALTFRDGTIDLRITAPDAASLDAIGQQLRAAQLAGGHPRRQRQRRQLSWPAPGEEGRRMMDQTAKVVPRSRGTRTAVRQHRRVACVVLHPRRVILPLNSSISEARQRIAAKQVDLAFIRVRRRSSRRRVPRGGPPRASRWWYSSTASARESGLGKS